MIRSRFCFSLSLSILLVFFVLQLTTVAQTPIKADWRCNFNGQRSQAKVYFSSEKQAQDAVAKIVRYSGLVQNFVVAEGDVLNAEAFIQDEKRIILYNRQFMLRLVKTSSTDWAATGVLAHEIGHHLLGHTIQSHTDPQMELEADRFAGFILQKMGASLEQAQAGWREFASEEASATHPGKGARLISVRQGWTEARDLRPLVEAPDTQPIPPKTTLNEIWFVTMSKASNSAQRYNVVSSLPKNEAIKANWKKDYYITSVATGDNRWIVIMDKSNPGYTDQYYQVSSTFPASFIREKWDQGFEITSVSYGQQSWIVVMTKGTSYSTQSYKTFDSFPRDWVKEKWGQGFYITSLGTGNGKYAVVMSKGSQFTDQSYYVNERVDADWIKSKWAQGFYITSVAKNGKYWAVVMSKGTNFTTQSYWLTKEFPREWIREKWDKGYDISSLH